VAWVCSTHEERRNACRDLVGKSERKRLLGSSKRECEDNIKTDIREGVHGDVYWINLAQDRDQWWTVVNTVMNHGVP
jgi:hypothetical protein